MVDIIDIKATLCLYLKMVSIVCSQLITNKVIVIVYVYRNLIQANITVYIQ